jgi:hypothetical protein
MGILGMGKDETDRGLTPKKVALLLKIEPDAAEAGLISQETVKAELLRDRLANHLPAEGLARRQLLNCLEDLQQILISSAGQSIERYLLAGDTPIETLRKIKEYGAALSRSAQSEAEQETANVIYYGAIASAVIFQGKRITQFKLQDLAKAFDALSIMPWLPPSLAGHFRQAMDSCRRLSGQAETPKDE